MHDTVLLQKIAEEVKHLCGSYELKKITKLVIAVNERSHLTENGLWEVLNLQDKESIGAWTTITVLREEMQDQVAILKQLEGEKVEGEGGRW